MFRQHGGLGCFGYFILWPIMHGQAEVRKPFSEVHYNFAAISGGKKDLPLPSLQPVGK